MNILIKDAVMRNGVDLFIFSDQGGKEFLLNEDTWVELGVGGTYEKPTLHIPREYLSQLMFALHEFGVKSPDESKIKGMYEAQYSHLNDLRKLLRLDTPEPVSVNSNNHDQKAKGN